MHAGLELRKLSLEDRIAFLRGDVDAEGPVISRAEPRDKQDIVRLLKEDGEVGIWSPVLSSPSFRVWLEFGQLLIPEMATVSRKLR